MQVENIDFTEAASLFLDASKSKVDDKIRSGYYTVIFTGKFHTKLFQHDNVIVVEDWISEEKYQDMTVVIDHDIAKLKCIDDGCKKFFTSSRKHNCKNVLNICITTEKWKVLMSIKNWRNKYIGHPKTGIMLADSALVEILKLAKQFHALHKSSEIYYDELDEISKCKSICCLYYRVSLVYTCNIHVWPVWLHET